MNITVFKFVMNIFMIMLNELDNFLMKHREMGLIISLMFLLVLITLLVFAIVGISAVESGTYYNHLQSVI